jgi:hypothetical protein
VPLIVPETVGVVVVAAVAAESQATPISAKPLAWHLSQLAPPSSTQAC